MKTVLIVSTLLTALCVTTVATADNNSNIAQSFVENRISSHHDVNLNRLYWSADRISIFSAQDITMCECDPMVPAGSIFTHDDRVDPVLLGEPDGYMNRADTREALSGITFEAWLDGEPIDVLMSGLKKWENFVSDPATADGEWTYNPDQPNQDTGCDWYFENRANPHPREPNESCWGESVGVDITQLAPGVYSLRTRLFAPFGTGPADWEGGTWDFTHTITVEDCDGQ